MCAGYKNGEKDACWVGTNICNDKVLVPILRGWRIKYVSVYYLVLAEKYRSQTLAPVPGNAGVGMEVSLKLKNDFGYSGGKLYFF